MIKSFIALLLICLPINQQSHKFYVSLTDIVYDQKESRLEITSDVFIDDFELLLQKRYQKEFKLVEDEEYDYTQKYIERYLSDKLILKIKNKKQKLQYVGKAYQDNKLRFYLKVSSVEPFDQIEVTNQILIDLYPEQKNMVHVNNGETTKTLLLEKDRSKDMLKF